MAKDSESDDRLLPFYIFSTRSVWHLINLTVKSFGHAIVFAHHPTDWNSRRGQPAKVERFIQHGLDKVKYPVLPCKILKLENQLRMRINFVFDDPSSNRRYAMYISKSDYIKEINLLYWDGRYAWIKHFSRLLYNTMKYVFFMMIVKLFQFYYMTIYFRNNSKMYFCTRCLIHFKDQKTLQQHRWYCTKAVDPENLSDQLRVTRCFSKHIRNLSSKNATLYETAWCRGKK